ncbi:hypothetical protein CCUS01_15884 [Colletotrichum cuscutae]|uniref:Uncharacterized protein n=1 Tax=Colletotrichum cuscutae TaxID=1209917 RepID=A0AAI9Y511_9PEZI|nr:hypothetical protein CCUS01_15884 [Colletotrichum cuscutae]
MGFPPSRLLWSRGDSAASTCTRVPSAVPGSCRNLLKLPQPVASVPRFLRGSSETYQATKQVFLTVAAFVAVPHHLSRLLDLFPFRPSQAFEYQMSRAQKEPHVDLSATLGQRCNWRWL